MATAMNRFYALKALTQPTAVATREAIHIVHTRMTVNAMKSRTAQVERTQTIAARTAVFARKTLTVTL